MEAISEQTLCIRQRRCENLRKGIERKIYLLNNAALNNAASLEVLMETAEINISTSTQEASLYAETLTRLSEVTSGATKTGLAVFFCPRFGLLQHSLGPALAETVADTGRCCRRTPGRSTSLFTSGK